MSYHKIRTYCFLGVLLILSVAGFGQNSPIALYSLSPVPDWVEEAPQAFDALSVGNNTQSSLVLSDQQIHVEKGVLYHRKVWKVHSLTDLPDHPVIVYDPAHSALQIHQYRIWRDNAPIDLLEDIDLISETKDFQFAGQIYLQKCQIQLKPHGLRAGDYIELSYSLVDRVKKPGAFRISLPLREESTALRTVRLLFDHQRPMAYWSPEGEEPKARRRGSLQSWSWQWKGLKASHEDRRIIQPKWYRPAHTLFVSDIPDASRRGALAREAFDLFGTTPASVQELAGWLQDTVTSPDEQTDAIINYLSHQIAPLENSEQYTMPPDRVIRWQAADNNALAVLSLHLFRELNISAYPILVNSKGNLNTREETVRFTELNKVIVALPKANGTWYFDPNALRFYGSASQVLIPKYHYGLALRADSAWVISLNLKDTSYFNKTEFIRVDGPTSAIAGGVKEDGTDNVRIARYSLKGPMAYRLIRYDEDFDEYNRHLEIIRVLMDGYVSTYEDYSLRVDDKSPERDSIAILLHSDATESITYAKMNDASMLGLELGVYDTDDVSDLPLGTVLQLPYPFRSEQEIVIAQSYVEDYCQAAELRTDAFSYKMAIWSEGGKTLLHYTFTTHQDHFILTQENRRLLNVLFLDAFEGEETEIQSLHSLIKRVKNGRESWYPKDLPQLQVTEGNDSLRKVLAERWHKGYKPFEAKYPVESTGIPPLWAFVLLGLLTGGTIFYLYRKRRASGVRDRK